MFRSPGSPSGTPRCHPSHPLLPLLLRILLRRVIYSPREPHATVSSPSSAALDRPPDRAHRHRGTRGRRWRAAMHRGKPPRRPALPGVRNHTLRPNLLRSWTFSGLFLSSSSNKVCQENGLWMGGSRVNEFMLTIILMLLAKEKRLKDYKESGKKMKEVKLSVTYVAPPQQPSPIPKESEKSYPSMASESENGDGPAGASPDSLKAKVSLKSADVFHPMRNWRVEE